MKFQEELLKRHFILEDYEEIISGAEVIKSFKNDCKESGTEETEANLIHYVEDDCLGKNGSLTETLSQEQMTEAFERSVEIDSLEYAINNGIQIDLPDSFKKIYRKVRIAEYKSSGYFFKLDSKIGSLNGYVDSFHVENSAWVFEDMATFELNDGKHHTLQIIKVN